MKRFTYRESFLQATDKDIEAWLSTRGHTNGPSISLDINVEDHVAHRVYTYNSSGNFIAGYNGFHYSENRSWFLPILPEHLLPPPHLTWERIMPSMDFEEDRYYGILNFLKDIYSEARVTMGGGDFPVVSRSELGHLLMYVRDYAKDINSVKKSRVLGRYKITRR